MNPSPTRPGSAATFPDARASGGPDSRRNGAHDHDLEFVRDQSEDNPEWDRFVAAAPGGHHVQTSRWARVKATVGWRASRIIVQRDGEVVGGCQLLWRSFGRMVRVAYAPRGPLVAAADPAALHALLDQLATEARALRFTHLKLQPPVDRHDLADILEQRGFARSELDVGPGASVRIDLRQTPEQLLANMASRIRRNLRQSDREGLIVREGTREDLPKFLEIISNTASRQGFENYPERYWLEMWDEFAPSGETTLFLSELDGRILSANLLVGLGDTVIYKMGGWTGERSKARPNESMHWAAIQWAQAAGFRYYDLEGIETRIARDIIAGQEPERVGGVTAFKLSLGGETVLYPGTYDVVYQPLRAWAVQRFASGGSGRSLVRKIIGRG